MNQWVLFGLVLVAAVAVKGAAVSTASACDAAACQLPNCRCSSTDIPGGLSLKNTPQFVLITFDDSVQDENIDMFRSLLNSRKNSNGCSARATFYVSHAFTDYENVNELYNKGHEIALHSISYRTSKNFWAKASYQELVNEVADQRSQMAHFANIPIDSINGVRMPKLQLAGDTNFRVMADHNLTYDASWPTVAYASPGLWPYTLNYKSVEDCLSPPCPTSSIPGPWVLPMLTWTDLNGSPCTYVDTCASAPDFYDSTAWYNFILSNFVKNYKTNKAPFGFYAHAYYFNTYPAVQSALAKFMDTVSNMDDVFMVTSKEVIDWVKSPVPVDEYKSQPCKTNAAAACAASTCGPYDTDFSGELELQSCNGCPRVYPWVGNPLGK